MTVRVQEKQKWEQEQKTGTKNNFLNTVGYGVPLSPSLSYKVTMVWRVP